MFFFWVVGSHPTIHNDKLFQTFPISNLKNTLPGYPQEMKPIGH